MENQQRNVSYDTKEYTIEIIVSKYQKKLEDGKMSFLFQIIRENLCGMKLDS